MIVSKVKQMVSKIFRMKRS